LIGVKKLAGALLQLAAVDAINEEAYRKFCLTPTLKKADLIPS
jgi:hypothetical protein